MSVETSNKKASTIAKVRKIALKLNEGAFKASSIVVSDALSMSKKWQGVIEKAINGGFDLLEKQQEVLDTALNGAKAQYELGRTRAKDLTNPTTEAVSDLVEEAKEAIEEGMEEAIEDTKEVIAEATKTVDTIVEDTTKIIETTEAVIAETVEGVVEKMTSIGKENIEAAKKATDMVVETAKKKAKKATNTGLASIKGVGGKTVAILNTIGINSLEDLASADAAVLKTQLAAAGSRYKNIDPTAWIEAAKTIK